MTDQEPYTRVPNALLDNMADLGNAELRVLLAIVRRTTGYQKACDVISLTQLHELTGLMRRHILEALDGLLERNYITREPAPRRSFCYRLVPLGNQYPKGTSTPREPSLVPLGNQSLVPLGYTQKKEKEKSKERGERASRATPAARKSDPVFEALAEVCGIDWTVCTKAQRDQLNQSVGLIRRAGAKQAKTDAEMADTVRYVAGYFKKHDWRGKQGDVPTPAQLREVWGAAIQERDKPRSSSRTNGHHPPPAPLAPEDIASGADIARLFRESKP